MMDSHLLRARTKSKSASTMFRKEDLKEAGIIGSTGKSEKERDRATIGEKDSASSNANASSRSEKSDKSEKGSSASDQPPSPRQLMPGFVAEEWKYGRVQRDSIKEGFVKVKSLVEDANAFKERWVVLYYDRLLLFKPQKSSPLHLNSGQRVAPKTKTVPADVIILLSIKTITNVSADNFAINLLVVNEGSDKGMPFVLQCPSKSSWSSWYRGIKDQMDECESTKNKIEGRLNMIKMHGVVASVQNVTWFELSPFSAFLESHKHQSSAKSNKKSQRRKSREKRESEVETGSDNLSHAQFIVNVDSKYYQERLLLKTLLSNISSPDKFYDVYRSLCAACKQNSSLVDLNYFLEKNNFSNPYSFILHGTFNPYERVQNLSMELKKFAAVIKVPSVCTLLVETCYLIENFVREIKLLQQKRPPLLCGGLVGQRLLSENAVDSIIKGTRDLYGLHSVTSYGGIHFKLDPESPGQEFAVDCLNKLISGMGSAPACLLKIVTPSAHPSEKEKEYTLQASKTVEGVNLKTVLLQRPDLINEINLENYTFIFLLGLLTNLHDGKPDNFIMKLHSDKKSVEVVGIDNDLVFCDPIVVTQKKEYYVQLRNILYLFPQIQSELNPRAREHYLQHSPEIVLFEWLRLLYKQNENYREMELSGVWSSSELKKLELPITLRSGTVTKLYYDMIWIRNYLTNNPLARHKDLLRSLQPRIYYYYRAVKQQYMKENDGKFDLLKVFEIIFGGPYLSEIEGLTDVKHDSNYLFRDMSGETKKPFDFRDERRQKPIDTVTELLYAIDFAYVPIEEQYEVIGIITQIPFNNFIIIGALAFGDRELQFLLDNSPSLQTLEMVRCNSITEVGVRFLLFRNSETKLKVIITDCMKIPASIINEFQFNDMIEIVINPSWEQRLFEPEELKISIPHYSPPSLSSRAGSQAMVSNQLQRKPESNHFDVVKSNYALNIISDYEGDMVEGIAGPNAIEKKPSSLKLSGGKERSQSSSNINFSEPIVDCRPHRHNSRSGLAGMRHRDSGSANIQLRESSDSINLSPRKLSATQTKRKLDYNQAASYSDPSYLLASGQFQELHREPHVRSSSGKLLLTSSHEDRLHHVHHSRDVSASHERLPSKLHHNQQQQTKDSAQPQLVSSQNATGATNVGSGAVGANVSGAVSTQSASGVHVKPASPMRPASVDRHREKELNEKLSQEFANLENVKNRLGRSASSATARIGSESAKPNLRADSANRILTRQNQAGVELNKSDPSKPKQQHAERIRFDDPRMSQSTADSPRDSPRNYHAIVGQATTSTDRQQASGTASNPLAMEHRSGSGSLAPVTASYSQRNEMNQNSPNQYAFARAGGGGGGGNEMSAVNAFGSSTLIPIPTSPRDRSSVNESQASGEKNSYAFRIGITSSSPGVSPRDHPGGMIMPMSPRERELKESLRATRTLSRSSVGSDGSFSPRTARVVKQPLSISNSESSTFESPRGDVTSAVNERERLQSSNSNINASHPGSLASSQKASDVSGAALSAVQMKEGHCPSPGEALRRPSKGESASSHKLKSKSASNSHLQLHQQQQQMDVLASSFALRVVEAGQLMQDLMLLNASLAVTPTHLSTASTMLSSASHSLSTAQVTPTQHQPATGMQQSRSSSNLSVSPHHTGSVSPTSCSPRGSGDDQAPTTSSAATASLAGSTSTTSTSSSHEQSHAMRQLLMLQQSLINDLYHSWTERNAVIQALESKLQAGPREESSSTRANFYGSSGGNASEALSSNERVNPPKLSRETSKSKSKDFLSLLPSAGDKSKSKISASSDNKPSKTLRITPSTSPDIAHAPPNPFPSTSVIPTGGHRGESNLPNSLVSSLPRAPSMPVLPTKPPSPRLVVELLQNPTPILQLPSLPHPSAPPVPSNAHLLQQQLQLQHQREQSVASTLQKAPSFPSLKIDTSHSKFGTSSSGDWGTFQSASCPSTVSGARTSPRKESTSPFTSTPQPQPLQLQGQPQGQEQNGVGATPSGSQKVQLK